MKSTPPVPAAGVFVLMPRREIQNDDAYLEKKMKKFGKLLTLIVFFALVLSACAPAAALDEVTEEVAAEEPVAEEPAEEVVEEAEAEPEMMVFYDDMENMLEFAEYPETIVSIAPSTLEILFAVGAGDQVVGRDEYSAYPEEAMEVVSIGSLYGDLPAEAILALEPDLILAAQTISPETVTALQDLGLQVYWQQNPETFEDLYENLRDIAALTGNQDMVEAVIEDLEARVTAVEEAVSGTETTPTVFYELDGTDPSNPWTTGSGTFIDYIMTMAGGVNAAADLQGDYAQMSAEALIVADPDVILLGDAIFGTTVESVTARAGWEVITAVQNGEVYPFNPDILSIPGPRLVEGLEEMAKLLHPDLFK